MSPTKKTLTIKTAYYGGNPSLYRKRKNANVLTKVAEYMNGKKPQPVTSNTSTYVDNSAPLYEDSKISLKVQLLIGNTTKVSEDEIDDSSDLPKTGAVNLNTVSLVVVVDWNDVQFITTGDATGITMLRANGVMGTGSGSFFKAPLMLTIPHHGSWATAFDFTGQNLSGLDKKREQIALFARRCGAFTLTASAGNANKFRHPSAEILDIFWRFASDHVPYKDPAATVTNAHFYTAYYSVFDGFQLTTDDDTAAWPSAFNSDWYTAQTVVPIFTTDQYSTNHLKAAERTPKVGLDKKRKIDPTPLMANIPVSVAKPSPGSVADYPSSDNPLPAAEVGWTIKINSNNQYSYSPIVPTSDSIAARHILIEHTERLYSRGNPASPSQSGRTGTSTSPPRSETVRRQSPPAAGPRPKRR